MLLAYLRPRQWTPDSTLLRGCRDEPAWTAAVRTVPTSALLRDYFRPGTAGELVQALYTTQLTGRHGDKRAVDPWTRGPVDQRTHSPLGHAPPQGTLQAMTPTTALVPLRITSILLSTHLYRYFSFASCRYLHTPNSYITLRCRTAQMYSMKRLVGSVGAAPGQQSGTRA